MFSEMKKILKITGSRCRYVILIALRSPVSILITAMNAVFLQQAFNAVAQNSGSQLTSACVMFGIASLFTFLYNGFIWRTCAAPLVAKMEANLRVKLFDKIASFPLARIEALSQGEWLTRLNTDVQMPFSEAWARMATAIVSICVSALILCRMNTAVFGWIILFVAPHILVSQLLIARVMPGLNKKSLEATAKNTDELTALITCADVAALYDGHTYLMKRFEQSSMALFRANMKMRARNALSAGILPLFGLGGYLTLLIIGSGWVADGQLSFGDLTAAFQYRGGVLLGALMLINCLISVQTSMAGVRRINETMAEETEDRHG